MEYNRNVTLRKIQTGCFSSLFYRFTGTIVCHHMKHVSLWRATKQNNKSIAIFLRGAMISIFLHIVINVLFDSGTTIAQPWT